MVEPSLPPSRVGAAAVPNSIFLTRQMILWGLPGACSAVPHSPVSGNVSSTRGLPLADLGIGSPPLLGGMSLVHALRFSVSHGSRCEESIQHPADRAVVTVLLCAPIAVMFAAASSQWCWPLWTGHGALGVRNCLTR